MVYWDQQQFWDGEQMGKPTRLLGRDLARPPQMHVNQEDMVWARKRPPQARTPLPRVGQRVDYRHWPFDVVVEAEVIEVHLETLDDWNVWRFQVDAQGNPVVVDGKRVLVQVDDPWPAVLLDTRDRNTQEITFGMVLTREARIQGSPGWLPRHGQQQMRTERR